MFSRDLILNKHSPDSSEPVVEENSRKQLEIKKRSKINKQRKNEGKEYISTTGTVVPAVKIGEMCRCPLKCFKLKEHEIKLLFKTFWDIADFDRQNAYLYGSIEACDVKRRLKKEEETPSYRQNTFIFKIHIDGKIHRVCKKSFMSIHGLQNHRGRVNNVIKKIKSNSDPFDRRGKHNNRANKFPDEAIAGVHEHIKLFPKYQSHFSKSQNPNRLYLGCDMTIRTLYCLYNDYATEKNMLVVSEDKFRRIFNEECNVGFTFPSADICKICELLQVKLEYYNEEDTTVSAIEKELHLQQAELLRLKMLQINQLAKEDYSVHAIFIDLPQALPTPKLSCPPSFYLRKLWTYIVGIHDMGKNQGHVFMWDESVAGKESDEIGSCIIKYLNSNNGAKNATKLIVFSDDYGGQIKNWNIMALWSYLIYTKQFSEIQHWFLKTGHTFLPSDTDFAEIEKCQRSHPVIYDPDGWKTIVYECGKKNNFCVQEMVTNNFYNFALLKDLINTNRKKYLSGADVKFEDSICFRFDVIHPLQMFVKTQINTEYEQYDMIKIGKISKFMLTEKYSGPRRIYKNKFADLMQLLTYIPCLHKSFYKLLQTDDIESDEVELV